MICESCGCFLFTSQRSQTSSLSFRGFRERLLADPSFFVKVGIEVRVRVPL